MSKARFRGSKFLTFRGHVLRSCVILLARAIAVSPWLGGPGCALPCFGFIGFRVSLCRVGCRIVGCRIVGCRIVGLLWKWVSAAFGNVLDQAGHKSSTPPSPTTPPRALKKIYTGRVKHKHGVWCLEREEKSMNVSVGGCLKQNMAFRREKKKVRSEVWARIKRVRSWI